METLRLVPLFHRKQECIGIHFNNCRSLNTIIKKIKGARWSQTNNCWYIAFTPENYDALLNAIDHLALIDSNCLEDYIGKRKHVSRVKEISNEQQYFTVKSIAITNILKENLAQLELMMEMLQLKAYSVSTIKTYKNEFCALLQHLGTRAVNSLTAAEVKAYILHCINSLGLGEHTIHSRLNALKFYFEQVLHQDKIFVEIPRPKKPFQLPKVLGEKEIGKLFNALKNKKHKAILFTAYSAGLRVSEVVNLQIKDIDSDRMQIFVQNAKGKKDRYLMLSPVLLDILRSYLKGCCPRPQKYLFEGYTPGEPLSRRSAQEIFIDAKRRAGLKKELSFHSLRHSFATHLLENGVDIKYIKELLGHFSIQTTTRYLHVKKENLVNILSPLDAIYKSGNMDF